MDVRLPNLGEGADSGTVVSLAVKEGDLIALGQTILELETGKAVAPIPSPAAGTIRSLAVQQGAKISVGQLILSLETSESALEKSESAPAPEPASNGQARPAAPSSEEAKKPATPEKPAGAPKQTAAAKAGFPPPAAPSLRKLARDLGIDLERVHGSESGGRIVLGDIRAYLQRLQERTAPPPESKTEKEKTSVEPADFAKWGSIMKKPMSTLRRTISRRMSESRAAIPEVTQFDDADITHLNELRKKYGPEYEKKGAKLTLTSFVLKALGPVLTKHLIFNSSLDEAAQEIILKEYINFGLAVDTEAGLMVPVIRDGARKTLLELSVAINAVAEKARDRKLSLEDMQGGTFTISNQGGIGGSHFTPIINKPEAAILGLGRGKLQPVIRGGKVEARLIMPVCLAYDHRIIDGGQAARFITDFVQALENVPENELAI